VKSNIATVRINVRPVNDAPDAQDMNVRGSGAGPVSGMLKGTDDDGDTLRYRLVRAPKRGTVTVNETTGRFVYTPEAGSRRIDVSFRFVVNDGQVDSRRAIVKIDYCNGRHDGHNHDRDDDDRDDRNDRDGGNDGDRGNNRGPNRDR
jgi:hypothetical protein